MYMYIQLLIFYHSGLFEVHSRLCDSRRMIIHMNEPIVCKYVNMYEH